MNLEQTIEAIQKHKTDRGSAIHKKPTKVIYVFGEETVEVEYIGDKNPFDRSSDE